MGKKDYKSNFWCCMLNYRDLHCWNEGTRHHRIPRKFKIIFWANEKHPLENIQSRILGLTSPPTQKSKRRWPLIDTFALCTARGWSHDFQFLHDGIVKTSTWLEEYLVEKINPFRLSEGAKAIWKSISSPANAVWGQAKVCLPLGFLLLCSWQQL